MESTLSETKTDGMAPDCTDFEAINGCFDLNLGVRAYYSNARWYDPDLGRFITVDPIKDGSHWYLYANANPLRYVDPTGLKKTEAEKEAERAEREKRNEERRKRREEIKACVRKRIQDRKDYKERIKNADTKAEKERLKQERSQLFANEAAARGNNRMAHQFSSLASQHEEKRATILEREQENIHETIANTTGVSVDLLSNLINIDNLADIFADPANRGYFDQATQDWMNGMSPTELKNALLQQLGNTTVYSGVDPNNFNQSLKDAGTRMYLKYPSKTNGLGLGTSIYLYGPSMVNKVNNMNNGTAALLGHEAVHGIQAQAYGNLSKFESTYMNSDFNQYPSGSHEAAAYSFGPQQGKDSGWMASNAYTSTIAPLTTPILLDPANAGWWQ